MKLTILITILINRSREDERLSWPCWLTYSGRLTHINGYPPSAAGPLQTSEISPRSETDVLSLSHEMLGAELLRVETREHELDLHASG